MSPRTTVELIADLLNHAVETEWSGTQETGCLCHPDTHCACPCCSAFESLPLDMPKNHPQVESRTHLAGCTLAAIITEARAFLHGENELATMRGDELANIA